MYKQMGFIGSLTTSRGYSAVNASDCGWGLTSALLLYNELHQRAHQNTLSLAFPILYLGAGLCCRPLVTWLFVWLPLKTCRLGKRCIPCRLGFPRVGQARRVVHTGPGTWVVVRKQKSWHAHHWGPACDGQ